MRQLPNTTGSISDSEIPGETGDSTTPFAREGYQNIIEKANTIPFTKVFKMYGIKADEMNKKIICPFKSHKGGRENSASFLYYPDTNTYHCFGCKQGRTPVDFVMLMDRCHKNKAAQKLLDNFSSDVDDDLILSKESFSERMEIMMEFANVVRDFHLSFSDDKSFKFIEENCLTYDAINNKHDLNNEALKSAVSTLISFIKKYKL